LTFLPLTGGHSAPAGEQTGTLVGLRLDRTRADMARAMMEGAAFELRWALDQIRHAGMPIERMWMIGGATSSPIWPNILADVTGVPLSLPEAMHWPAVGAAILAGMGIGAFETLDAGRARFLRPARQIDPDRVAVRIYDGCFASYQHLARLVRQEGQGKRSLALCVKRDRARRRLHDQTNHRCNYWPGALPSHDESGCLGRIGRLCRRHPPPRPRTGYQG
jgi:sugar (pentulose or hexulose) kinase